MADGNGSSTDPRLRDYWQRQQDEHDRARAQEHRLDALTAEIRDSFASVRADIAGLTEVCRDVLRAVVTGNGTIARFSDALTDMEKRVAALETPRAPEVGTGPIPISRKAKRK
jgi:hypothetical protein